MPLSINHAETGASLPSDKPYNKTRDVPNASTEEPLINGRIGLKERADGGNAVRRPQSLDIKAIRSFSAEKLEFNNDDAVASGQLPLNQTPQIWDEENGVTGAPTISQKRESNIKPGYASGVRSDHADGNGGSTELPQRSAGRDPLQGTLNNERDANGISDPTASRPDDPSRLAAKRLLEFVHAPGSLPTDRSAPVTEVPLKLDDAVTGSHFEPTTPEVEVSMNHGAKFTIAPLETERVSGQGTITNDDKASEDPRPSAGSNAEKLKGLSDIVGLPSQLIPIAEQNISQPSNHISTRVVPNTEPEVQRMAAVPRRLLEEPGEPSPAFTNSPHSPSMRASGSALERPSISARTMSTPVMKRKISSNKTTNLAPLSIPAPKASRATSYTGSKESRSEARQEPKSAIFELKTPSIRPALPIPPFSLPTHLHLELSSTRPSPLYIQRQQGDEIPYEPSHIKLERLLNFFLLPPMLERVLLFGALACFDAWLYTFTILPLRFCKAIMILAESWSRNTLAEVSDISHFIYAGLGRVWRRRTVVSKDSEGLKSGDKTSGTMLVAGEIDTAAPLSSPMERPEHLKNNGRASSSEEIGRRLRHRRTKSGPSYLLPVDKADLLKGLLIMTSCYILMYFDASMMYHNIRGQAAIKLYVIYNALEVFDRLLSALGQDVLECLFAKETLDRKPNGRSKLLRPAWLFLLALVYNILHSLALFYQVITLNVAVNSYSNALLTLLMSNQFVEIKSTVFKKIEKENLFQLTCADIVERFQLWLMLIIIASRNIVETGGLGGLSGGSANSSSSNDRGPSLLPQSFTLLPDWTGVVMGPFFLVLGTEMLVDWIKHAYINKFNSTKPNVYGRFLDVLAKDYYSRAFTDTDLTKRVGLATIPLSCLFIRASVQTYHMFLATHTITPLPSTTSLEDPFTSTETTPAIRAAIQHIDTLFKRAIFGADSDQAGSVFKLPWLESVTIQLPTLDTLLTYLATILIFTIFFLLLLILKILLGMFLLSYARARYASMQTREKQSSQADGKRLGGWGVVEVGDEKRRWIYEDDPEGLKKMRDREKDARERESRGGGVGGKSLDHVERYSMVAKRIW